MLELPDPDRSRLTKSPLDLVVFQIRFDQRSSISAPAIGFAFQTTLGARAKRAWKIEPIEGPRPMNITVTAEGPQV